MPSAVNASVQLLAYQLEPALAVARYGVSRILIADGVGLGKTIQAGLILLELLRGDESCRAIVLTPAGLREQWRLELSTRLGVPAVVADTRWLRSLSAERPAHVNPWAMPGIYIASHDFVKRPEVLRPIEDVTWDAVVIDEAHVATVGTDRRAALNAIALRARHVVLLTATPHDSDALERDALLRIGEPASSDAPIVVFRRSRMDVRRGSSRRTRVLAVTPSADERQMHALLESYTRRVWDEAGARHDSHARLVSIVLRKRALSSAGSLLSSVERRLAMLADETHPWQAALPLWTDPDEDPPDDDAPGAHLAVPGLSDARSERRWLSRIAAAARRATADERKVHRLLRFLEKVAESVIVFTEYRDTLTRLAARVTAAGHEVYVLHGGLSAGDRARVQRNFNNHGGTLLATDAASEGLNLHLHCRVVVHFELPWTPSRLEQRAGRVDRFGQTKVVHELALVTTQAAERLVLVPLVRRLAAAGAAGRHTLNALSESSIAAAVMMAEPLSEADEPSPSLRATPPPDGLALIAATEATRLERHRLLEKRSASSSTNQRGAVATRIRSRRIAPGFYFVFALALNAADGSALDARAHVIRVEFERHVIGSTLSATELSDLVSALTTPDDAVLAKIALGLDDHELDRVSSLAEARWRLIRGRDESIRNTMAAAEPHMSQLLVQAGLFDRRSLRAAARRADRLAALDDPPSRGPKDASCKDASSRPTRSVELLAAICVTPGP